MDIKIHTMREEAQTIVDPPKKKTWLEMLAWWREKTTEERRSQESCLSHFLTDQSKWHEGRADMLDFCADQLEFVLIRHEHSIYTHCFVCQKFGVNMPNDPVCGNCGSEETVVYFPIGKAVKPKLNHGNDNPIDDAD